MIAVSWIGLRLGMQFNMPESTYIRWKLQKPNEITPNGCRSASGGQHTKKKNVKSAKERKTQQSQSEKASCVCPFSRQLAEECQQFA